MKRFLLFFQDGINACIVLNYFDYFAEDGRAHGSWLQMQLWVNAMFSKVTLHILIPVAVVLKFDAVRSRGGAGKARCSIHQLDGVT